MKNKKRLKNLLLFFLIVFGLAGLGFLLPVQAQELFPGEFEGLPQGPGQPADYRRYIQQFYQFSIAASVLIATVLIMIGGMIWVTSAGNQSRITKAKEYISNSIIGVILLMSAYLLLQFINPRLVTLESPGFEQLGVFVPCVTENPDYPGEEGEREEGTHKCSIVAIEQCSDRGGKLPTHIQSKLISNDVDEITPGEIPTCDQVCPPALNLARGTCNSLITPQKTVNPEGFGNKVTCPSRVQVGACRFGPYDLEENDWVPPKSCSRELCKTCSEIPAIYNDRTTFEPWLNCNGTAMEERTCTNSTIFKGSEFSAEAAEAACKQFCGADCVASSEPFRKDYGCKCF